ncbi:hypothetical protein [Mycobacteroides abscessus]|uniref:hypothetical protein n=1 Tax=Mycobacteroides abscessus TaxID=36809 RepID=UPI000925DCB4|nr:hypothetical protein [Mycobacteroides abscessus]SHP97928.1 Uncharacterised protein [Mycobacteroides abscessus subsp. abscessus]SHQ60501.1 Uncharacterised protein [Mycobacteroides abscessus subsp. abscessus]SKD64068.1 Uncharacterised protein [Mycobacteroides abscessus subsp. abscessus]SLD62806.1 Uncharacterised protein [Mycobacteroides abscessus subsp. abscessus]
MTLIATVTNITNDPELDHGALALLTGYPVTEITGWQHIPPDAARAARRRRAEAEAFLGVELGMYNVLAFYAVKERASLRIEDRWIVSNGVPVQEVSPL